MTVEAFSSNFKNTNFEKQIGEPERKFGIGKERIDRWIDITEGAASVAPANFLKYQRRTKVLMSTALDLIKGKNPVETFFATDWLQYKMNNQTYWEKMGENFNKSGLPNLEILDVGAGLGSLYGALKKSGITPKKYTAVEPTYAEELKERFHADGGINIIETLGGSDELDENIKGDIVILAGVAPYYSWESDNGSLDFKTVLADMEAHVKPGGVIAFSFSLDASNSLEVSKIPTKLRQLVEAVYPSDWNRSRFTAAQLESSGYTVGPEIFVGTFVGYKKIPDTPDTTY